MKEKKSILARIESIWIIRFMIFNTMLGYWGFTLFSILKNQGIILKMAHIGYFLYPVIIIHYHMKTLDLTDTGSTRAWMAYTQFLRIVSWDQVRSLRSARRSPVEQISWSWIRLRRWVEWVMGVGGALRSSITRVREVKLVWKQDVQQVTWPTERTEEMDLSLCVTAVYRAWSANKRLYLG